MRQAHVVALLHPAPELRHHNRADARQHQPPLTLPLALGGLLRGFVRSGRERLLEESPPQRQVLDVDQRLVEVVHGIDHQIEPCEEWVVVQLGRLLPRGARRQDILIRLPPDDPDHRLPRQRVHDLDTPVVQHRQRAQLIESRRDLLRERVLVPRLYRSARLRITERIRQLLPQVGQRLRLRVRVARRRRLRNAGGRDPQHEGGGHQDVPDPSFHVHTPIQTAAPTASGSAFLP